MRLDRFLSERTPHSRSVLRQMIGQGRVQVGGAVCRRADTQVQPTDAVVLDGQPVAAQRECTLMLHKPAGYVTSAQEAGQQTVLELLPPAFQGRDIMPVGRLDKMTTGLLLLTNDGALAHRLIAPAHHVPKVYLAALTRPWTAADSEAFRAGLTLGDGTVCRPAQAMADPAQPCRVLIELTEGKYHQVRRMCAAVGNHVETLHRAAVGALMLPDTLGIGQVVQIPENSIQKATSKNSCFSSLCQFYFKNSS